jgi:hypothetical protein
MGQDQWDRSRPLASLMDEVDPDTLRRVAAMAERGKSFDLRFPIETIPPVCADLL